MKVFVIGSGGREHALVWALSRSTQVKRIYSATRNVGIVRLTQSAAIDTTNPTAIADFAQREKIDLVIVGPEQPLVDGVVDVLSARGIAAFGPARAAARLEGSKVFSKQFMQRHAIPTARGLVVNNIHEAETAARSGELGFPLVVKAEGLAAGKGVIIAEDAMQATQAVRELMLDHRLGAAGARLVLEECLLGREISYLVLSDGEDYTALPVAQDHKRAFDGDLGPNTGGMGAFSRNGLLDEALDAQIKREVVEPTLLGAKAEGFPFRGVLYCGLMLTASGPQLLEYNVRFGDPETQAILRRLESDFGELALAVARGGLRHVEPRWSNDAATCVVMASAGYPGDYQAGKPIEGLAEAEQQDGVIVFHAGTRLGVNGRSETAGGRVLGITARAATLSDATAKAYRAVNAIRFEGAQFRKDIGLSAPNA